ncbi:MAG: LCP family protein [Eubacterium sp.]|nr:LCP family protein [Eubacterium sp.]
MRIFKNRGDIYFSKTNKKKSAEQKILIIALVAIVIFTIAFVIALSVKYDFSAKNFFAPDNLEITQVTDNGEEPLPKVSGKNNFITLVSSDENLLFVILTQVDFDNISYKVCTLKASTISDGKSLNDIFKQSGAQNVKQAVESLIGVDFDYYISMTGKQYADFFDELGDFYYPVLSDIKFKSSDYSLRLSAGEQRLNGSQIVNLIRYYVDEENNFSLSNDLILSSLSQQINSDNLKKSEYLFRFFVTNSDTNITVRDFSLAGDELEVLADYRTGPVVYGAQAEYENNSISADSLQKIKGYFVK